MPYLSYTTNFLLHINRTNIIMLIDPKSYHQTHHTVRKTNHTECTTCVDRPDCVLFNTRVVWNSPIRKHICKQLKLLTHHMLFLNSSI